jgi:DNA (cytosine-5)-methyltransferase 1
LRKLTLGSLFDGSGGFPLAAMLQGIEPLWASEVEPFAIRVTTKRLPQVRHLGDINRINGADVPPVDIITGGFCCQDLSVAGKRAGLRGERSGLFFQVIRIVKEMRAATDNAYPRFLVLENVPGMYSSAGGADFLEVLNEIIGIKDEALSVDTPQTGKWLGAGEVLGDSFSLAWRTLDAQFWGVAQRRRRCFLVADFTGQCAGTVLFESEGVSGYSPQDGNPWEAAPGGAADGVGEASGAAIAFEPGAASRLGSHIWVDLCGTIRADMGDNQVSVAIPINTQVATRHIAPGERTGFGVGEDGDPAFTLQAAHSHAVAVENHPADSRVKLDTSGTIQTLTTRMGTGGGNVPLVMNGTQPQTLKIRSGCEGGGKGALLQNDMSATISCNNDQTVFIPAQAFGIGSHVSNAMLSDNPVAGIYEAETSRTLDGGGGNPSCNQGGIAIVEPVYTLPPGAFGMVSEDIAGTLLARDYKDVQIVSGGYAIRRLTPSECAVLQGFPPGWCTGLGTPEPDESEIEFWSEVFEVHRALITKANKPRSRAQIVKWLRDPYTDSAEYRLWGNGVALPCVRFVIAGIVWAATNFSTM